MTGFFKRIFGLGKSSDEKAELALLREVLRGVIERGSFELDFVLKENDEEDIHVNFSGADEKLLVEKEGMLLDSLQLFCRRVLQHHFPDLKGDLVFDVNGFRDEANEALIALAEKLKELALEKGRSVYCRALAPKDRKFVHQYLSNDGRVKTRSVGEGLYKKIKIYPAKNAGGAPSET